MRWLKNVFMWACKVGVHDWEFVHYDGYCWVRQCRGCGKRTSGWTHY